VCRAGRRLEVLQALQDARRCCDETGGAAGRGLSRRQQLQVSRALARASVRAGWPLPAPLARLLAVRSRGAAGPSGSPGSVGSSESVGSVGSLGSVGSVGSVGSLGSVGSVGSIGSSGSVGSPARRVELEARLVAAAEAVHRLSPHPAALGAAVELLDAVAALDRVEPPRDPAGPRAPR
jgi:hypothetical protein